MFQAKLKLQVHSQWVLHVIKKFKCELISLYCANIDKNRVLDIIVFSHTTSYQQLIEYLKQETTILEFQLLEQEKDYIICKIITQYTTIIHKVLEHGCFSLGPIQVKDNFEYWTIGSHNKNNIKHLLKTLNATRKTTLLQLTHYNFKTQELTHKQHSIIVYAHKRGYFDIPKNITLQDLSSELNIAPSTLAVHLQKAEKKIITKFLTNSNEYIRE